MEHPLRVVVLGGGPGLCDRLRVAGARITLVETPAGYDPTLVAIAERTLLTGYDDAELIPQLAAIHDRAPFAAVLSLTEKGLLPAARIAERLGVAGLSTEVVARTRDKLAMRTWLADKGFSVVGCAAVADADEIRRFAVRHGYPVIVKPRQGQGSDRVYCFRSADAVVTPPAGGADGYIAEPFLDGPEFSVEAFSRGGEHHVLAITGKLTNDADPMHPFVEPGHVVPAPIEPDAAAAITAYVTGFLDVMGISDGPSHTEVRLTDAGPQVIETHTRVGGDAIPTLVRQVTGHDLLDLTVDGALRRGTLPPPGTTVAGAAAIRFFTPPPGMVTAVAGLHRAQGLPGVLKVHLPLAAGDTVEPVRNSGTRAGYVLAVGRTAAQAIETCRLAMADIRIDVR